MDASRSAKTNVESYPSLISAPQNHAKYSSNLDASFLGSKFWFFRSGVLRKSKNWTREEIKTRNDIL